MLVPFEMSKLLTALFVSNSSGFMDMDSMVLHFGNRELILFGFWKTGSPAGLAVSLLIVFLMSILYEAIKALRLHFARNRAIERQNEHVQTTVVVSDSEHVDSVSIESVAYSPLLRFSGIQALKQLLTCYRIVQSALYLTQTLLAYTLMLIAMTFNIWIILSIVFGEAVGYFLFSGEPNIADSFSSCC